MTYFYFMKLFVIYHVNLFTR